MPYPDRLPNSSECPEYFMSYIRELPEGSLPGLLSTVRRELLGWLEDLEERDWRFRYAEDKWSVAQVVGHLCDCERVFQYRALCFARGAVEELPGFDENVWARHSLHHDAPPRGLLEELRLVREASHSLFALLDEACLWRTGRANGLSMTPGAIAWTLAGHELHHARVLRERYDR